MVCTEDHHFTARLQKHQVANACTENSMNHENHKFLHRSFFLLQLRWDLFHIVTFKSTVVLLNVPPVRTGGACRTGGAKPLWNLKNTKWNIFKEDLMLFVFPSPFFFLAIMR